MKTLVVGLGEIGSALYAILFTRYENQIYKYDVNMPTISHDIAGLNFDFIHICIPGALSNFKDIVAKYKIAHEPRVIVVHSTVKPGTCGELSRELSIPVLHSPTRGKHPHMASGILTYVKYIGFDGVWNTDIEHVVDQLKEAGIKCTTINGSKTTEVGKILETTRYGVNLMWADMEKELCDHYGVKYDTAVTEFLDTYNQGIANMGTPHLKMQVLTPPDGHIGGHCVVENTYLLDVHNYRARFVIDNIQRMKKK